MNIFSSLLCHGFKCWSGMAKVITPTIIRGTCGIRTLRKYTGFLSLHKKGFRVPTCSLFFFFGYTGSSSWCKGFSLVAVLGGFSSGGVWVSLVAMACGNLSSPTTDGTRDPCTGRWTLNPLHHQGVPGFYLSPASAATFTQLGPASTVLLTEF